MLDMIFGVSIALNVLLLIVIKAMRKEVRRAHLLAQAVHDHHVAKEPPRDCSGRFVKRDRPR